MVARSPCQSLIVFFTTVLEVDSFFFFSCGFIGFLLISFGKVYASRFVVRVGKCWVFFPFFFFLSYSFWLFTSSLPSCSVKRHAVLLDVLGYFRTFCGEIARVGRCQNAVKDYAVSSLPVQLMILCDGSFHCAFCFGKISSEVPYYTGTHETDLTWKEKNSLNERKLKNIFT